MTANGGDKTVNEASEPPSMKSNEQRSINSRKSGYTIVVQSTNVSRVVQLSSNLVASWEVVQCICKSSRKVPKFQSFTQPPSLYQYPNLLRGRSMPLDQWSWRESQFLSKIIKKCIALNKGFPIPLGLREGFVLLGWSEGDRLLEICCAVWFDHDGVVVSVVFSGRKHLWRACPVVDCRIQNGQPPHYSEHGGASSIFGDWFLCPFRVRCQRGAKLLNKLFFSMFVLEWKMCGVSISIRGTTIIINVCHHDCPFQVVPPLWHSVQVKIGMMQCISIAWFMAISAILLMPSLFSSLSSTSLFYGIVPKFIVV